MIPAKTARRFLDYNPETGVLTWRITTPDMFEDGIRTKEMRSRMFNARYGGREALTAANGDGYKSGKLLGLPVTAHRVCWLLANGNWPKIIDHVNGNKTDNRLANLREVSAAENGRNMSISPRNKSGVTGIRYEELRKRWACDIRHEGYLHFLGRFKCIGEAIKVRREAERRFGFHTNHGKR